MSGSGITPLVVGRSSWVDAGRSRRGKRPDRAQSCRAIECRGSSRADTPPPSSSRLDQWPVDQQNSDAGWHRQPHDGWQ